MHNTKGEPINLNTSEIGIAFRAWQDNDEIVVKGKHDTDPGTNTPTEAAVKAFLGQGDLEIGSGSYQQALSMENFMRLEVYVAIR